MGSIVKYCSLSIELDEVVSKDSSSGEWVVVKYCSLSIELDEVVSKESSSGEWVIVNYCSISIYRTGLGGDRCQTPALSVSLIK